MINGKTYEEIWNNILQIHHGFIGKFLEVNEMVYEDEASTNQRNQAITKLLESSEKIDFDPSETYYIYTRQYATNINV